LLLVVEMDNIGLLLNLHLDLSEKLFKLLKLLEVKKLPKNGKYAKVK